MKRWMFAALAFAALAATVPASAQPGTGADKKEERVINATGVGTIKVKPDAVRLSFGVLTGAATVKETRVENVKNAKKVLDALNDLKIQGLEVKMVQGEMRMVKQGGGGVVIGPGGPGGGDLMPVINGYRATTGFTVSYKDANPDKLREVANKVLDAALDAGANVDANGTMNDNWQFGIGGLAAGNSSLIEYTRGDMIEPQRQALAKAVEDALVNAKALAGGAKVTIADTIAISDVATPGGVDVNNLLSMIYGAGGGQPKEPATTFTTRMTNDGEVEIVCRVSVRCRY